MQRNESDGVSYKKMGRLGEGSFGEVYLVKHAESEDLFVSKEIKLHNLDVNLLGIDNNAVVHRSQSARGHKAPVHRPLARLLQNTQREAGPDLGVRRWRGSERPHHRTEGPVFLRRSNDTLTN